MAISVQGGKIIEEPVANSGANHMIDITGEVCPLTFVRAKLVIEKMNPGETLDVRLKGVEPLRNVPRSARELGHEIVSLVREAGEADHGVHILRLRKAR